MGKFRDLTGQTFGRLLVLKRNPNKGKGTYWYVECSCGKNKVVRGESLISGHTKSCGCYGRSHSVIDIIGKRFGRLVVKELVEQRDSLGERKYRCVCDCGEEKEVRGSHLRAKEIQSCGCLKKEDLTGSRFTRLLVIGYTKHYISPKGLRQTNWLCLCDCGAIVVSRTTALKSGLAKSCGCLRTEMLVARNTTHGLSRTKGYKSMISRRRKEREASLDSLWTPLMEMCLRNYQPTCVVCGSIDRLGVDHVLPLSKGNGLYPGNAVILCKRHNCIKHAKYLDQLPIEMATKIKEAAESFRVAWSGGF